MTATMVTLRSRASVLVSDLGASRPHKQRSRTTALACFACILCGTSATAQMTELVSLGQGGVQGTDDVSLPTPGRLVSTDGRFVVFRSYASNLVAGDNNQATDVFLRDRQLETTELVSVSSSGVQGNGTSGLYGISMTPDGRFVVFESASNNLVAGDTNGAREVFLRDRLNGTTEPIALNSSGVQAQGPSFYPSISDDGRYVSFTSPAVNLVTGDTNGTWDVFVRDRLAGTTERVSVSTTGVQGDGDSYKAEISADGQFVVFESNASSLVAPDTNYTYDVFVHDRQAGTTEMESISTAGVQGNSSSAFAAISGDGRFVVFHSLASNLVASDTNGTYDTFVHDRQTGTTEMVSVSSAGVQASAASEPGATISADGRFVCFGSGANNLVSGDTNSAGDMFIRDLLHQTTERVTLRTDGSQIAISCGGGAMSADGRYVVFLSNASDIVQGDVNGHADMFLRDRFYTGFVSLCDPGVNGVIDCPCGNPPAGPGRGCDNSSATGGAALGASGSAHVSTDSLVFTTSDERASATSILLQGDASIATGIVFGQGVRCTGGLMKRLYIKVAANGVISAPDLAAGDPTVTARSSFLGAPIQAGDTRYYLVYYRDPVVLGGCFANSTYNATQTGQILWLP